MGLLFLTRHEGRLVLDGRDYDPTWKPFPGSELDRAWDGDAPETSFEGALAEGLRRDRPFIDVNANSKHWRRSTRVRALVVTTDAQRHQVIIGVGNCATETRRGRLGTAVVRLSDWRLFQEPVSQADLLATLSPKARDVVARLFDEEDSRAMPDAAAKEAWAAMRELVPNFGELLGSLPDFPSLARVQVDDLTSIDAGLSALRFFSSSWRQLEPIQDPPPPTPLASRLESIAIRDEDEVITDDTGGFLDWESDRHANGGWYLFRSADGRRELRVKNINFKDEETATGADLVYVRADPDAVVLVQYKLLTSNKDSAEYFFRDSGGRLLKQVKQMLSFSTAPVSDADGDDDYRMGNDIGFVKFVVPTQPVRSADAFAVPEGRYHPAEGVLRMLAHPSKGPKMGDIHRVGEWRSLDGETFAKLVRDQWIGSAGEVTREMLAILGLARKPLFLAVEETRTAT